MKHPFISNPPATEPAAFSRKAVLDGVRRGSSYKALRGLISFVFLVAYLFVGVLFVIAALYIQKVAAEDARATYALAFAGFLVVVIAVVLMAFKEAFSLAIDAVDILILNRADQINTSIDDAEDDEED
jgi:hypothetical protein